nr:uncharacterized protein LOC109150389 [Ipomoea trifida]
MEGKMLSAKRSSEDQDLLERSTKKPNVDGGDAVLDDMEVAVELGDAQAEATPDLGSVEVVAETPVAEQGEARIKGSDVGAVNNGSEAPSAEVETHDPGLQSKSAEVVNAATRRKSAEECDGQAPEEGNDENQTENGGHARPSASTVPVQHKVVGGRPYGPWMIATRRERRQVANGGAPGGPLAVRGQKPQAGTGGQAGVATGSRFAPLGDDGVATVEEDVATEGEMQHGADTTARGGADSNTAPLGGRQKRANVIANEKQITNEPQASQSTRGAEPTPVPRRATNTNGPRRAAEEDGHVVVRGAQGGKVINSETISSPDTQAVRLDVEDQLTTEHHRDPPEEFDAEGDVVMDVEVQQGQQPAGGC